MERSNREIKMLVYLDIICPKKGIKNLFKAIFYRKKPLIFQKAIEDISYLEIYCNAYF